jgi:hypothetical protein
LQGRAIGDRKEFVTICHHCATVKNVACVADCGSARVRDRALLAGCPVSNLMGVYLPTPLTAPDSHALDPAPGWISATSSNFHVDDELLVLIGMRFQVADRRGVQRRSLRKRIQDLEAVIEHRGQEDVDRGVVRLGVHDGGAGRRVHRGAMPYMSSTARPMSIVPQPSPVSRTICARQTCFWGLFRPITMAARAWRSASEISTVIRLRIRQSVRLYPLEIELDRVYWCCAAD